MSDGSKSIVNCTRLNFRSMARDSDEAEQRLGDARHALQQNVTAGEQRDQQPLDHRVLADHHLRHALAHVRDELDRPPRLPDWIGNREVSWPSLLLIHQVGTALRAVKYAPPRRRASATAHHARDVATPAAGDPYGPQTVAARGSLHTRPISRVLQSRSRKSMRTLRHSRHPAEVSNFRGAVTAGILKTALRSATTRVIVPASSST